MRKTLAVILALAALAPSAAYGHVTLQPSTAPQGAFARLDVRVPNERDDESTEKVEVQLPDGFPSASYEPVPGWSVEVTTRQFDPPIQTEDGEITEGVDRIIWTADSEDDAIPPGAFKDFGLSVRIPGKAGDELTFRALQTYTGGEVVRWIGAELDNPAAVVTVTEPVEGIRVARRRLGRRRRGLADAGGHDGTGRDNRGRRRRQRPRDRGTDRRRARPRGRHLFRSFPPPPASTRRASSGV